MYNTNINCDRYLMRFMSTEPDCYIIYSILVVPLNKINHGYILFEIKQERQAIFGISKDSQQLIIMPVNII